MERPFPTTAWQPTKAPDHDKPHQDPPSEEMLAILIQRMNGQTRRIYEHPYDPNTWLQRAKTLEQMWYTELTVGDATKASVLAAAHLSQLRDHENRRCERDEEKSRTQWRLGYRMSFWMLDSVETQVENERGMLREYLRRLQSKAGTLISKNLYFSPVHEEGRFRRRPYPWMQERHSKRSAELIEQINLELKKNAAQILHLHEPTCFIKGHAFGQDEERDTSDLLGVFAARAIAKKETIIVDRTRTWGCNGPGTDGSRVNLHGGYGCLDPIHPNDEDDEGSQDLRWVRDLAGKQASATLLIARLLLCCVQDGIAHPLDHPLIARLTPTYMKKKNSQFSVQEDLSIPMTALQRFGIDIFANPAFDTWVLFTIHARATNNCCGDPITESLNPLFSLFNHSCEPNVRWSISEDHRTITIDALRDLEAGEQLFVEYDGFMANQPLETRRKTMWRWLAGPCMCTRCVREEREEVRGRDSPSSGSSSADGDRVDEKMVGTEKSDWKVAEKELPVFPEDLLWVKKLN